MSQPRLELRVGVFVLIGLVLLAALMILLSKGISFSGPTLEVRLRSDNVGGIKKGATVLLSGVQVGTVSRVELDDDGKGVTMFLKISKRYKLFADAKFDVETAGFLGDQFIAITPTGNVGPPLTNGAVAYCRAPFDVQEALAQTVDTISRIGQVTTNVNAAVVDVRRFVLTEQKLSNLGASIDRFAMLTLEAQNAVSNINALISGTSLPLTVAVSNLAHFSIQLSPLATNVNAWLASNEERITALLQNFESASVILTNVLHGLDAGEGAAGRLLRDEEMAANLAAVARNLAVTSSNLNQRGLWGIMWKQKQARSEEPPPKRLRSPNDTSR